MTFAFDGFSPLPGEKIMHDQKHPFPSLCRFMSCNGQRSPCRYFGATLPHKTNSSGHRWSSASGQASLLSEQSPHVQKLYLFPISLLS